MSTEPETVVAPEFPAAAPIRPAPAPARPVPAPVHPGGSQHRLHDWLAFALMAAIAIAPIPLGSNRPAFWTIWGAILGLLCLGYAGALLWMRAAPRLLLGRFWPEALLFAALLAWLCLQIVPTGALLTLPVKALDGTAFTARSISLDPGGTWLELIQFATYGLMFFLVAQVAANRRRARRLLLALLLIITAFAGFGLLSLTQLGDTLLGFEKQFYQGYATGTFVNRNSYATFLAAGLAIGTPQLLDLLMNPGAAAVSARIARAAAVSFCLVTIAAALFATGSRMGALAAAAGVALTVTLGLPAFRGTARIGGALVIVGVIVASVLLGLYGTELLERLVFTRGLDEGRTELHRQVWAAIQQRPWSGFGGGSFASVFPLFQEPSPLGDRLWDHAHSTYLALWFELGLIAGTIPLLIIGLLGWRTLATLEDSSSTVISLAGLGVVAVFALHSLIDFSAEIQANAFLLTVMLALGASTLRAGPGAHRSEGGG